MAPSSLSAPRRSLDSCGCSRTQNQLCTALSLRLSGPDGQAHRGRTVMSLVTILAARDAQAASLAPVQPTADRCLGCAVPGRVDAVHPEVDAELRAWNTVVNRQVGDAGF